MSSKNSPVKAVDVFFNLRGCFHSIQQFFSLQKSHKSHFQVNHDLWGFWIMTIWLVYFKVYFVWKNDSNKSCSELNFLQKSQCTHICTFCRSGARGPKVCYFWNMYYNALEWVSRFTVGLKVANNTDFIKKCFKQKLFTIKFPT